VRTHICLHCMTQLGDSGEANRRKNNLSGSIACIVCLSRISTMVAEDQKGGSCASSRQLELKRVPAHAGSELNDTIHAATPGDDACCIAAPDVVIHSLMPDDSPTGQTTYLPRTS
jgi:hypothetical protein